MPFCYRSWMDVGSLIILCFAPISPDFQLHRHGLNNICTRDTYLPRCLFLPAAYCRILPHTHPPRHCCGARCVVGLVACTLRHRLATPHLAASQPVTVGMVCVPRTAPQHGTRGTHTPRAYILRNGGRSLTAVLPNHGSLGCVAVWEFPPLWRNLRTINTNVGQPFDDRCIRISPCRMDRYPHRIIVWPVLTHTDKQHSYSLTLLLCCRRETPPPPRRGQEQRPYSL